MPNLCTFTADADPLLLESAAHVGVAIKSYTVNPWIGWTSGKLKAGVNFLSSQTEEFAMWVDGYDSLILKPEADILARLQSLGFPLLISAERNCWPDASNADKFPEYGSMPRYPCAGGFIGLRSDVITAMHQAILFAEGDENDQRAWSKGMLAGVIHAQIDHARRIFCSEGDGDTSGANPCVRHWNGKLPGRKEAWEMMRSGG